MSKSVCEPHPTVSTTDRGSCSASRRRFLHLAASILVTTLAVAYPVRGFEFLPDLPDSPPSTSQGPRTAFRVAEFEGSLTSHFVTIGNVAYFETSDPFAGTALWKSDGTSLGTQLVKNISPIFSCCPSDQSEDPLVNVGTTLFFAGYEPATTGSELWKSDGTTAGTQIVADLVPGSGSSGPYHLTASGGGVYFVAGTSHGGAYLFRSDGTEEGTQQTAEARNPFMFSPWDLTDVDGTLYFNADDIIDNRQQLWKTDGTPDGTLALGRSAGELTNVNGTLFFTRGRFGGESIVYELWKSDAAGTALIKEIAPDSEPQGVSFGPSALTNVNGTLFFIAQYSTNESALWKSDGTHEGTQSLTNPFTGVRRPGFLTNVDGTLFFAGEDGSNGRELWKSDGTASGTQLVKDIRPGVESSDPSALADVGGRLLFAACDDVAGCEPWVTTPSYPGAVRVADIAAGPVSSNPTDFTRVGNLVLFRVHRGSQFETEWELWAVPLSVLALECSNGIDDDGDGLIDFDGGASANGGVTLGLRDPGCFDGSLISAETRPCQDAIDNDGDGQIDFDGGALANHGVPLAAPDPECTQPWDTERPAICGLGVELIFAMPLLAALRRRIRRW